MGVFTFDGDKTQANGHLRIPDGPGHGRSYKVELRGD